MGANGSKALPQPGKLTHKPSADAAKQAKDMHKLKKSSKSEAKLPQILKPAKEAEHTEAKKKAGSKAATPKIVRESKPSEVKDKGASTKKAKAAASLAKQGGIQTTTKKSGNAKKASKKAIGKPQEAHAEADEAGDAAAEASHCAYPALLNSFACSFQVKIYACCFTS